MKEKLDTSYYGVGINDSTTPVTKQVNGKTVLCKYYSVWKDMIKRCYDPIELDKTPSYVGCSVDPEWHRFSAFRDWMSNQDYAGKQLDKDLLFPKNKIYSKDTCVFISKPLNIFMIESIRARGPLPLGVSKITNSKKFQARCRNPFTKKSEYLGSFGTPELAHLAWKAKKHEIALEYAKAETDPRIIKALQTRYK